MAALRRCRRLARLGDRAGQQDARGDLRVERLGRGDAHLHVAPVADVYITPSALSVRSLLRRLTMAITAAPRPRTRSTVRLVSVVVPALADGDDQRVAHVEAQAEPADSSVAVIGVDVEPAVGEQVEQRAPRSGRRRPRCPGR